MFKGLRLFSVRGIPIFLHWSAVLILALVGFDIGQVAGPGVAVAAAAAFLGSILAHELAHAMVASHYGVATERITLWGLGGLAQLRNQTETPRAEAAVAAAGPAMSAALGVVGVATESETI